MFRDVLVASILMAECSWDHTHLPSAPTEERFRSAPTSTGSLLLLRRCQCLGASASSGQHEVLHRVRLRVCDPVRGKATRAVEHAVLLVVSSAVALAASWPAAVDDGAVPLLPCFAPSLCASRGLHCCEGVLRRPSRTALDGLPKRGSQSRDDRVVALELRQGRVHRPQRSGHLVRHHVSKHLVDRHFVLSLSLKRGNCAALGTAQIASQAQNVASL